jgi:menaquinol-cytochrome c reductase iron-sulfur subunit
MGAQCETVDSISTKRRTFMGVICGLIVSGIAAVLGVTIGRYAIGPALTSRDETEWTDLGPLTGIPEGKPVRRNVIISQNAGWGRFNTERLVWVIRQGETVMIFTAVCPHLGCTVGTGAAGFVCACHSSKWNARGERLSGPAPRGLDVLEHRIEGDIIKIKYQNFRHGTLAKEVIS